MYVVLVVCRYDHECGDMYVDGACNARHSECVVTLVCTISVVNVAKIHLCSFQSLASLYTRDQDP